MTGTLIVAVVALCVGTFALGWQVFNAAVGHAGADLQLVSEQDVLEYMVREIIRSDVALLDDDAKFVVSFAQALDSEKDVTREDADRLAEIYRSL